MHRIVEDGLEDYLAGRVLRDFEVHVENCEECRVELEEIGFISSLFRESFAEPAVEVVPSPGFYARLNESIEARKPLSLWAFFSIDAIFGRRVAFASLLALALVGGFLVSRESNVTLELQQPGAEAIIAQHDPASTDPQLHRDEMLVKLASYER